MGRDQSQFRIIAGRWRGRRLSFATSPGVRPTPDRLRETLFNWLQGHVAGKHCLDLYAGSGALGFEALSRGAAHVTWLDNQAPVISQLRQQYATLKITPAQGQIIHSDALTWLHHTNQGFDLVFLDPPFQQHPLAYYLDRLQPHLNPNALLYWECHRHEALGQPPSHWQLQRQTIGGAVAMQLMQWRGQ